MTAIRWSSDFVFAEYRDLKAKTITLDSTGNFLFFPGKTQLAIKNLSLPIDEITTFPRQNKHEPGATAWNPHIANKDLCALASGIHIELLVCKNNTDLRTERLLKSHTRVVTSLEWHPQDPNVISTTSLDTFTYIWDIREPLKPAISLSSFAAASHVKWNKISRHLLATAHAGDVKIWDERKMSSPVQYISAHLTSIHCLDWSPFKENQFCTASQDGTIKFFDVLYPRKTENVISAEAPVWRACYTPFGRGMLVIVIPVSRKVENTLLLWNLSNNSVPLHTFVGHSEIVLDFQWRYYQQGGSDYQLITWSKDQTLRIWEVDKYLQELCGPMNNDVDVDCVDYGSDASKHNNSIIDTDLLERELDDEIFEKEKDFQSMSSSSNSDTNESCSKSPIRDNILDLVSLDEHSIGKSFVTGSSAPANLQQEFSTTINIPNVQILKTDVIRRICCAMAKCNNQMVSLLINFPPSYPRNRSPIFKFAHGTTVPTSMKIKILEALRDTAELKVKNNQSCLEACLRSLIFTMQQLTANESEKAALYLDEKLKSLSNSHDGYYLAARTCGAKFGFVDRLICFAKPLSQLQSNDKNICGLVSLSNRQTEALTKLYLQNKNGLLPPRTKYLIRRGLLRRIKNTQQNKRVVLVYDVSSLFFLNKELALKYKLNGPDIVDVCRRNAQIANSVGRKDLQQVWNLALITMKNIKQSNDHRSNWENYPLGTQMLQSLILFYISQSDLQTSASLCCIFQPYLFKSEPNSSKNRSYRSIANSPSGSPYHAFRENKSGMIEGAWSYPTRVKHVRSSSWSSEFSEDVRLSSIEPSEGTETSEVTTPLTSSCGASFTIEDNNELLFDRVKRAYADVLNRWQLLSVRAMMMKSVKTSSPEVHNGLEFQAECKTCKTASFSRTCASCKIPTMYCVICRLSVKGLAYACIYCGHGGHLNHMRKWYETESCCPGGCKCRCFNVRLTTS